MSAALVGIGIASRARIRQDLDIAAPQFIRFEDLGSFRFADGDFGRQNYERREPHA